MRKSLLAISLMGLILFLATNMSLAQYNSPLDVVETHIKPPDCLFPRPQWVDYTKGDYVRIIYSKDCEYAGDLIFDGPSPPFGHFRISPGGYRLKGPLEGGLYKVKIKRAGTSVSSDSTWLYLVPHYAGPSLSQWGIVILLLSLAGIATWVVLKTRRVAPA